jgi:hypothetical protein
MRSLSFFTYLGSDPTSSAFDVICIEPTRTTLGGGLPEDCGLGEATRTRLSGRVAAEKVFPLASEIGLFALASRPGDVSTSPSRSALTEALNFGSGTSSSELSPVARCFDADNALFLCPELLNVGEIRSEDGRICQDNVRRVDESGVGEAVNAIPLISIASNSASKAISKRPHQMSFSLVVCGSRLDSNRDFDMVARVL